MDTLTSFLTSMLALSMGVERVVEVIKGFSGRLRDDPPPYLDPGGKRAARRRVYLQIIATLAGAGATFYIGPHDFLSLLPNGDYSTPLRWFSALFLGLIASGGSAFWNHALDIIGAIKTVRERVAAGPTVSAQRVQLPSGP